jgi:hypothetical protein
MSGLFWRYRSIFFSLSLALALPLRASVAQDPKEPMPSRWSCVWRSTLLPGWGQWHKDQDLRGWIYFGGVAAAAGASYYFNTAGDNSYVSYRGATTVSDAKNLLSQTKSQDNLYSIFSYAALGLYAVNILDAGIAGFSSGHPDQPDAALTRSVVVSMDPRGTLLFAKRWSL